MTGTNTSNRTKIALATLVGTTIEWYDFFVYGIAAALVFNSVFFPQMGTASGLLASLATFGVSFVARPIGGLIAGQVGDRMGRKNVLVFTLLSMGVSSFLIGVVPSYETIGPAAPVALVILRFVQGLSVGGEWGGAAVLAVESAPPDERGFWGSFPQMGGPLGLMLANGVMLLTSALLGGPAFLAWGWRIPFLLSVVLLAIGLTIRRSVVDTAEAEITSEARSMLQPLKDVWAKKKAVTAALVAAQAGLNIAFYVFSVTALTYLTQKVGVSRNVALSAVMIGAAADILMQPVFGRLSDRIGRKTVMIGGNVALFLMAFLYYRLASFGTPWSVILATVLGLGIGHAATYAPLSTLLAEYYPTKSRYTGVSIANQLANLLWSAPTPFLAVYLSGALPGIEQPSTLLLCGAAVLSIIGILLLNQSAVERFARHATATA